MAANTLDSDEIVVGANGRVLIADLETPVPATLDGDWGDWLDLGYLTEDGFTFSPNREVNPVGAWQSLRPVRRIIASTDETLNFTMLQWSSTTLPFALGGGTVEVSGGIYTFTPDAAGSLDERSLAIEWIDGDKTYQLVVPKGMVTDLADITGNRSDASGLGVAFGITADGDADPYYIRTDDPAFAEGS